MYRPLVVRISQHALLGGGGGLYLVAGCTCSLGVYLVQGGVPSPGGCTWSQGVYLVWGVYLVLGGFCTWSRGVYLVPGGCTWSQGGVCLVPGGVPGPWGVDLVQGCTWSRGDVPGPWRVYLVPGGVPGPGGGWVGVPGPRGMYLVLGCTWSQGVYLVWGVYLVLVVDLVQGGGPGLGGWTWSQGVTVQVLPPVNRILDTHFWKYYLAPNFVCRW